MISTLLAASAGLILGIRITLMALMLICAVCIIVFVMRQHGEEDGLGAISGQTETQDSFYGKELSDDCFYAVVCDGMGGDHDLRHSDSRFEYSLVCCGIAGLTTYLTAELGFCRFFIEKGKFLNENRCN